MAGRRPPAPHSLAPARAILRATLYRCAFGGSTSAPDVPCPYHSCSPARQKLLSLPRPLNSGACPCGTPGSGVLLYNPVLTGSCHPCRLLCHHPTAATPLRLYMSVPLVGSAPGPGQLGRPGSCQAARPTLAFLRCVSILLAECDECVSVSCCFVCSTMCKPHEPQAQRPRPWPARHCCNVTLRFQV